MQQFRKNQFVFLNFVCLFVLVCFFFKKILVSVRRFLLKNIQIDVKKFYYLSMPLNHFETYLPIPLIRRLKFNSQSDMMLKILVSRTVSMFLLFITRYIYSHDCLG